MSGVDYSYFIKPFIPRYLQIFARRLAASIIRKRSAGCWPIFPIAGETPKNWKGWPEGKKFALLLIHDVDTKRGCDNCLKLAEIESRMGFKSAYYFVPEDYHTPYNLRQQLSNFGFEIGLHGLTHDGKKYRNIKTFSQILPRINTLLKEWGAVGYTSPSMLGNLRWNTDLNIEYSCSSFDTDPFEPRPFGVATIFPFMVENSTETRSYVEIPYTLPQDHTLFIILRERDISIWKRKLDWVAENGGVALVNTHPDYMIFNNGRSTNDRYPSHFFADFLEYVASRYNGQYWNCLPKTLARFWRSSLPKDAAYNHYGVDISAYNRASIYSKKEKLRYDYKLALVCAPGGHFEQMQNLRNFYKKYPHFWITIKTVQTEHSLRTVAAKHFINYAHFKKPWTYLQQIPKLLRILSKERPTHIISTGSGIVVFIPFLLSRLLKIRFVHIETFSHVYNFTKFGKALLKFRHPFLSQWDGINHKLVSNIGTVISNATPASGEGIPKDRPAENTVFVTLGTRIQEYPRLLKAVEALIIDGVIEERVIAQAGSTNYLTALMETFDYCSPEKIDEYITSAKYIITQESAGIVTKCLKAGIKFIVMPRDYQFRELPTKSDMQEDLHYKLAELGYTFVVHTKEQLKEAIQNLNLLRTGYCFDNRQAITYLDSLMSGIK